MLHFTPPISYKLANSRTRNLLGQTFGHLVAIQYIGPNAIPRSVAWLCLCSCGSTKTVISSNLLSGTTVSCGCQTKALISQSRTIHGCSNKGGKVKSPPEYAAYRSAKSRCNNPKNDSYRSYGERGIEFRFPSYPAFFTEVGPRPSPSHSLDRIDVNGHYEVGNVRWVTPKQQGRNRRIHRMITANGLSITMAEWSEISNIHRDTINSRLEAGWCDECSVTMPVTPNRSSLNRCPHI